MKEQELLVTHMVNLSQVATDYKITSKQAQIYFDNDIHVSIQGLSLGASSQPIIESNVDPTILASITARKNRERIYGFLNSDGTQKYKG